MTGPNLVLKPGELAGVHDCAEVEMTFLPQTEVITEHGVVPQRFFTRNPNPNHEYDVIVVGSGTGDSSASSSIGCANDASV